MYRSIFLVVLGGLLLLESSRGFDSGLSGREQTTHFGLTECALLRTAASYLKSVYGSTGLDNLVNNTELCDDVEMIFNIIQREARRLGLNSAFRSVIDLVCTSNVLVNLEESTSLSSHFDNEAFAEGSILIVNRLVDTQTQLMTDSSSVADARQSFGQAAHTLQDFYAHSNWVELGWREPNPAIGLGAILGKYLYPGVSMKPKGKYSHGGSLDMTTQIDAVGFGINKNNEKADQGSYHTIAAQIALTATIQQLELLWSTVGNDSFGQFLGFHSSSLVITIDTTGSMSSVIELVKQVAIDIVEYTRGDNALFRPSNYILSPFNDPDWGPLTKTTDAQVLINAIKNLTAHEGGDTPELYYTGLKEALHVCEANSYIFTFTDAPAKDADLHDDVLAQAIKLKARIYSFYVGGESISGKRRRRRDIGEILDGSSVDDLATITGGSTIGLEPGRDANATTAFVIRRLFPQQSLLTITGSSTFNATFAVDPDTTRIQIDLTSNRPFSTPISNSLQLTGPGGISITPVLVASSVYFRLYNIDNPTPGVWKLLNNQNYSHTIEITIPENSNTSIVTTCDTTLSRQIIRESNNVYGPLLIAPTINQSDLVLVTSCRNLRSPIQSATIELIDKSGQIISTLDTFKVTKTESIITSLVIPVTDFRMLTKIQLTDESIVQRQSNIFISPTLISILISNQPYTLTNNSITQITFTIYNRAQETLLIRMCARDTLKLLGINGTCRNYAIASMNSSDDNLNISIDVWSEENNTTDRINMTSGSITFTINATNSAKKEFRNYNKIPFYIQTRKYMPIVASSNAGSFFVIYSHSYGSNFIFLISIILSGYGFY